MVHNCNGSPAVTTGMSQQPYVGALQGRNGQVGVMGRQPFKCAAATLCLPISACRIIIALYIVMHNAIQKPYP